MNERRRSKWKGMKDWKSVVMENRGTIDYEKIDEKKTLGISLFVVAMVIVSIVLQLRAESVGAEAERFGINFVTLIVLVVFFSSLLILTRMKGKKR